MQLDSPGERGEQVEVQRRQGRNAENAHPGREAREPRRRGSDGAQEIRRLRSDVRRAVTRHQCPPERGLPVDATAALPIQDHVRTEDDVLVERIGDTGGELNPSDPVLVTSQVCAQGDTLRPVQQLRQHSGDRPQQRLGLQDGAGSGVRRQGRRDRADDQVPRERKIRIGPHAEPLRQLHRQPAFHTFALHDDALGRCRRGHRPSHKLGEHLDENLHAIAAMDVHRRMGSPIQGAAGAHKGTQKVCGTMDDRQPTTDDRPPFNTAKHARLESTHGATRRPRRNPSSLTFAAAAC